MEKPSLTGSTAQKILSHMKKPTRVLFSEEMDEDSLDGGSTRQKKRQLLRDWNSMCDNLNILWMLIEKRTNNTDDLHIMSHIFTSHWIKLLGKDHFITNYIHVVCSGHLAFFAAKFRNLYRFSQQGWESLNQLLKHYYFNNTNHGGACGNGGKNHDGLYTNGVISGNHCRPLMLLCQGSIMWKLGIASGDAYFENISTRTINELDITNNEPKEQQHDNQSYVQRITYGIL
jgi:hypothetical protein